MVSACMYMRVACMCGRVCIYAVCACVCGIFWVPGLHIWMHVCMYECIVCACITGERGMGGMCAVSDHCILLLCMPYSRVGVLMCLGSGSAGDGLLCLHV